MSAADAARPPDQGDQDDDGRDEGPVDEVEEASEESFPASDSPQGWAGPSGG